MDYRWHEEDDRDESIAQAIHAREIEHHNYDITRKNFEHALESYKDLADDWPAHLARHKELEGREKLAKALGHTDDFHLAHRYQHRDQLKHALATTLYEMHRVEKMHAALLAQIEPERLAAAMARVKAKRQGAKQ